MKYYSFASYSVAFCNAGRQCLIDLFFILFIRLILPYHYCFSHDFMNIGFKSSGDILDTSYIKLCADDFFQLVDYVRILTVQINKSLEIAAAAAAASLSAYSASICATSYFEPQ
mgnify:CR=1 FL=1